MHFVLLFLIESSFIWLSSLGWTAPKARWPSEWICYTNITRQNNNQPPDYGTQIYSWSNRAQSVLHADMFRSDSASTLLWRDNVSYVIENNYNSCCHLAQFEFPMPNVNWTDLLSYVSNDTFNGIPSYLYANASLMDVKYWVSIDTGLPVGWSNVPNATFNPTPIIQYFYAAVEYNEPLSADYFILPSACIDAPSCPIIQHDEDDNSSDNDDTAAAASSSSCSDKKEVELTAALVVVPILALAIGLGAGFFGGKHIYERKPTSMVIADDTTSQYNVSPDGTSKKNMNRVKYSNSDRESTNPMNTSSSIELLTTRDGSSRNNMEVL